MKCHYCACDVSPLSMVSKFMCKYCRKTRKNATDLLPPIIPIAFENPNPPFTNYRELRGLICEDFIGSKMSIAAIEKKRDVSDSFISKTISMYLDSSQPINITFTIDE